MKHFIIIVILLTIALPTFASTTSGMLYAEVITTGGISQAQDISELIDIIWQINLILEEIKQILNYNLIL